MPDEHDVRPIVLEPSDPLSKVLIKDFDEQLFHSRSECVFSEIDLIGPFNCQRKPDIQVINLNPSLSVDLRITYSL